MSKNLIFSEKKDSFIRKCPGSPNCYCCDYYIISPAYGCPFSCSYCFMNSYFENNNNITLFSNEDELLNELNEFLNLNKNYFIRIGSGEFTDSLAIPELDKLNIKIINIFKKFKNACFEFKTKSSRVNILLNIEPVENIICGFSMNPQWIIDSEEKYTASFEERLNAAIQVSKHGYKTAFHFDPIFMSNSRFSDYLNIAKIITESVSNIAWISMGGFRYTSDLKLAMLEQKIGSLKYFSDEFVKCSDGKYRYPKVLRLKFYNELAKIFNSNGKVKVYTCMESADAWRSCIWDTPNILNKLHPSI